MIKDLRIWGLGAGIAVVGVLAGGFVLGVQPQLDAAAATEANTTSLQAQNQVTQTRLTALAKESAKLDTLRAEDKVLRKAVPTQLKPNTFVRRMNELASLDGVQLTSVAPAAATAYTAPVADTATGTSSVALAKTDPLITAANFAVIPVSVGVTGSQASVLQFVHDVQNDERLFLVTALQTSVDESGVTTGTLSGSIYTLAR